MTHPAANHALAIVAALAKRAGGKVRVEFDELADPSIDVLIATDETGITAEIVDVRASEEEAAAAVERAERRAAKIAELLEGAAARGSKSVN